MRLHHIRGHMCMVRGPHGARSLAVNKGEISPCNHHNERSECAAHGNGGRARRSSRGLTSLLGSKRGGDKVTDSDCPLILASRTAAAATGP